MWYPQVLKQRTRERGGREKETLCNEVFVDAEDGKEDTEQQRHLGLTGKVLFSH